VRVLGVDPSSRKIGVTVFEDGKPYWIDSVHLKSNDISQRCLDAFNWFQTLEDALPSTNESKVAFIEGTVVAGARNLQSTIKQAYVSGPIQACLLINGYDVSLVPIGTWKKLTVGTGNATKEQVSEFVRLRWPAVHASAGGNQDILDSCAIASLPTECGG